MKWVGLQLGMLALTTALGSDWAAADGVLDAARLLSGGSQVSSGPSMPAHAQASRSWSPVTWHYYRPAPPAYHRAPSGGAGASAGATIDDGLPLGLERRGDALFDRDVKPEYDVPIIDYPAYDRPVYDAPSYWAPVLALDPIQKPIYERPLIVAPPENKPDNDIESYVAPGEVRPSTMAPAEIAPNYDDHSALAPPDPRPGYDRPWKDEDEYLAPVTPKPEYHPDRYEAPVYVAPAE
jgi:hypothetical protein